jgi:DNA-binding response OmpR family regulator
VSSPANILVVEDEAHLAQGLLFNLRAEGYTVQLAVDGESALEMLASEPIDAIILDVMTTILPSRSTFPSCWLDSMACCAA